MSVVGLVGADAPTAPCAVTLGSPGALPSRAAKIKRSFRTASQHRQSSALTPEELWGLVARCAPAGVAGISEADFRRVVDALDVEGRGRIEFDNFIDFLIGERAAPRAAETLIPAVASTPMLDGAALRRTATELRYKMGATVGGAVGRIVVCVLGGTRLARKTTEHLVWLCAAGLPARLGASHLALATAGMPGVQAIFSEAYYCGARGAPGGRGLYHLVHQGGRCEYAHMGTVLPAGANEAQRRQLTAAIGDVYLAFEGGQGVACEARAAADRGAVVIPVRCSALPAMQRPPFVRDPWSWRLLGDVEASAAEIAHALVEGGRMVR